MLVYSLYPPSFDAAESTSTARILTAMKLLILILSAVFQLSPYDNSKPLTVLTVFFMIGTERTEVFPRFLNPL